MKTTIAINLGLKFVAVEAELVTVCGIPCGIHKRLGKSGWAVTALSTGLVLAKGPTRVEALAHANVRVADAGADKVLALLAKQPAAPAVETLEAYVAPIKAPAAKIDLDALVDLIADHAGGLNEGERLAVRNALNSRTGQLKAKSPGDDWTKAAWNGLQPNAWKIQFSACFLRGEPAELLTKLSRVTWPAALDKDLHALRTLGVA